MSTHNRFGYDTTTSLAMDRVRAEIKALEQAKIDVAPYTGVPTIACDSAAAVYRVALSQMGVDHADVSDSQVAPLFHATRTMARQPKSHGMPSASAKKRHAEMFPNANRLGGR